MQQDDAQTEGGADASSNALDARDPADGDEGGITPPDFPDTPEASTSVIPAGTALVVRLVQPVSTETNVAGDVFEARLSEPVVLDGETLLPANATARGRIVSAQRAGRVSGVSRIELVITELDANGRTYPIQTAPFVAEADTERGEDALRIGTGAGIGAAIGAIVGGGEGAAIGTAIGGGAGTAVVLTDRGDDIVVTSDAPVGFELAEAVTVSLP